MNRFCRRCLCVLCMLALSCGALAETQTVEPEVDLLEVDHKLYEYGYRDENCNGEMDQITINALKNFQTVNGLPVTGEADDATVQLLMYGQPLTAQDYLSELAKRYNEAEVLSEGDTGDDVKKLQRALKEYGYFSGTCDGSYGAATAAAVYRFQLANGLEKTSVAGGSVFVRLYEGRPISWDEYVDASCASVGDSGAHVRRIQLKLKYMGYFTGACTGRYGDATQQAVKRFQANNALEASGEVDLETYLKLFSDNAVAVVSVSSIRRGDTGNTVSAICGRLQELGYPANESFDYRSELGVMLFQKVNDLDVSGVADEATRNLLFSEDAQPMTNAPEVKDIEIYGEINVQIYKYASELLGRQPKFESCFELVQYVYLQGGVALADESQIQFELLENGRQPQMGEVVLVKWGESSLCGIATDDRAMIYCQEDGYIVTGYLNMFEADAIYHWPTGAME